MAVVGFCCFITKNARKGSQHFAIVATFFNPPLLFGMTFSFFPFIYISQQSPSNLQVKSKHRKLTPKKLHPGAPLSPIHDVKDACYLKHQNPPKITSKHLPTMFKLTEAPTKKRKRRNIRDVRMTKKSEMLEVQDSLGTMK